MNKLNPRLTPKRAAWLEKLRDHGPAEAHSVVGYACRKLGWSEWDYRVDEQPISKEEATERLRSDLPIEFGPKERITPAGLAKIGNQP